MPKASAVLRLNELKEALGVASADLHALSAAVEVRLMNVMRMSEETVDALNGAVAALGPVQVLDKRPQAGPMYTGPVESMSMHDVAGLLVAFDISLNAGELELNGVDGSRLFKFNSADDIMASLQLQDYMYLEALRLFTVVRRLKRGPYDPSMVVDAGPWLAKRFPRVRASLPTLSEDMVVEMDPRRAAACMDGRPGANSS